jgi:hypothetical protein
LLEGLALLARAVRFSRHGLTTPKQTITSASPLKFQKLFVGAENGGKFICRNDLRYLFFDK